MNQDKDKYPTGQAEYTPNGSEPDTDKEQLIELHQQLKRHAIRNSFFLWVIGFINNFHYCLVISAASDLAAGYDLKRLVALITWANVFFGIVARIVNMFFATHLNYNIRITAMALFTLLGLFFVSFSSQMGRYNNGASFTVMLIGVILSGTASNYGEAVVLTFVQRYPATMVGAWSSGTGISGVAASLIFIGLTSAGLTQQQTFLVTTPLCLVYWLCFVLGMSAPQKVLTVTTQTADGKEKERNVILRGLVEDEEVTIQDLRSRLLSQPNVRAVSEGYRFRMITNLWGLGWRNIPRAKEQPISEEEQLTTARRCCCNHDNVFVRYWRNNGEHMKLMHNTMWWFFFNLAVVYIAEYAAQLMAPFSFYCEPSWQDNFWVKNSYVISQFCYQFGVLISRSSLLLVKIKYVGVISILQIANAVCWIVQSKVMFIKSTQKQKQVGLSFVLFAWMLFIGLLGGASYVNVFYLILKRSQKMQNKEEKDAMAEYLGEERLQALLANPQEGEEVLSDDSPVEPTTARQDDEEVVITTEKKNETTNKKDTADGQLVLPEDQLTAEELQELQAIRRRLADVWYVRREMGMNIGAMYATIGITLGNVVDLIFTNTMLKNSQSC
ncbi:battenin [Angomonas deanei]|uniref:CLN3 protein, putative n=1 Tax=Angomonas deanei TaxID=59799 RepID=A0A7G2CQ92_9TRYP|nr:battenin [Angomonas deanei]CAD2221645.1 CLN3 protein, putative [Angomonas deanei]|eukprot:EPY40930.1 battenin [Angomonas deanei]